MALDPAVLTALAAIAGSAVGGSATVATAWLTQRTQGRREHIEAEIRKREGLYAEFISEASKLIVEALDHQLTSPERLFPLAPTCRRRSFGRSCSLVPTILSRPSAKPADANSRCSNAEPDRTSGSRRARSVTDFPIAASAADTGSGPSWYRAPRSIVAAL